MKNIFAFSILLLTSIVSYAQDLSRDSQLDPLDICLITGLPPSDVKFEKIQKIKIGKSSYGSVTDILPKFANKAKSLGANAVVNYIGSQRFGFWPWRFVRPIVRGEAVKLNIDSEKTCKDAGGATVRDVIATNKEPHKI
ncbi:hypothetical protein ACL7TT_06880 [Microbulbifer sp. 2304DJ12-6]|uniref:hypothetical protein n=1 Tax=Microbulbifer sp. 2304DJ12-6 TaxID=3233340 RepID=UPI0039B030D7